MKKILKPCEQKELAEKIIQTEGLSVSRTCRIVCLPRSMYYYQSVKDDNDAVGKLNDLAERYPTRGFDNYYGKKRNQDLIWNRKGVLRIYREIDLKMRRKRKRRLPSRIKKSLEVPTKLNATWSIDFMSDALINGRRFRVLNVIDDWNREALINEVYYSIPAERLVNALQRLIIER